jgi:hypothetical protein
MYVSHFDKHSYYFVILALHFPYCFDYLDEMSLSASSLSVT